MADCKTLSYLVNSHHRHHVSMNFTNATIYDTAFRHWNRQETPYAPRLSRKCSFLAAIFCRFIYCHVFSSHRYVFGIKRMDFLCCTIMVMHYYVEMCNLGVENCKNACRWLPFWKLAATATLPPAANSHHRKSLSIHPCDYNDISHYKLSSKLPHMTPTNRLLALLEFVGRDESCGNLLQVGDSFRRWFLSDLIMQDAFHSPSSASWPINRLQ